MKTDLSRRPWRLNADNFTPPERTPWGGQRILREYKKRLAIAADKAAYRCVGEAWEVSIDAGFSSVLTDYDRVPLAAAIAADPMAALGHTGSLPMIVKLVDAAQALSVQVHPRDGDPHLRDGQCGKPEAWFIRDADAGAGVYLGFAAGVSIDDVRRCLAEQGDLSALMSFVPVQRGDCFAIEPGLVHAIGPGVTLVEPQIVRPGKEGVTYRFWDWNRRYDASGKLDPNGKPRALHVEESLAVVDVSLRAEKGQGRVEQGELLSELQLGSGVRAELGCLNAFVICAGEVSVQSDEGQWKFSAGEAFVLPAQASTCCQLRSKDAWLVMSTVRRGG